MARKKIATPGHLLHDHSDTLCHSEDISAKLWGLPPAIRNFLLLCKLWPVQIKSQFWSKTGKFWLHLEIGWSAIQVEFLDWGDQTCQYQRLLSKHRFLSPTKKVRHPYHILGGRACLEAWSMLRHLWDFGCYGVTGYVHCSSWICFRHSHCIRDC